MTPFGSVGTITAAVLEKQRGEEWKQKDLHEHFLQDDHHGFLHDTQATLTDKTQASDTTKREYFWMRTLKTYYPYGLIIEESY